MKEKFSVLFDKHYRKLYNYAFKSTKDVDISEELVQEAFIKLWENIDHIHDTERSIESFLIITLKNKMIDWHRKVQSRMKHTKAFTLQLDTQIEIDNDWDLIKKIDAIYSNLNKKTLEIFQLSRDKGYTYKEIAKLKNISIKTVELHVSKALAAFRDGLKDFI